MYKIYTAGKMSGISFEDQMHWRDSLEKYIGVMTDKKVQFVHPPVYYNYERPIHKSELEIKEWDTSQIATCDIVVVNLEQVESSIGTHFELGFIDAINRLCGKHIYVVGIGDLSEIHPWIGLSVFRSEPDAYSAADYIVTHLLI